MKEASPSRIVFTWHTPRSWKIAREENPSSGFVNRRESRSLFRCILLSYHSFFLLSFFFLSSFFLFIATLCHRCVRDGRKKQPGTNRSTRTTLAWILTCGHRPSSIIAHCLDRYVPSSANQVRIPEERRFLSIASNGTRLKSSFDNPKETDRLANKEFISHSIFISYILNAVINSLLSHRAWSPHSILLIILARNEQVHAKAC